MITARDKYILRESKASRILVSKNKIDVTACGLYINRIEKHQKQITREIKIIRNTRALLTESSRCFSHKKGEFSKINTSTKTKKEICINVNIRPVKEPVTEFTRKNEKSRNKEKVIFGRKILTNTSKTNFERLQDIAIKGKFKRFGLKCFFLR